MTNGGVDGSGYFTWHANNSGPEGSEDTRTRIRGFYPDSSDYFLNEGSPSTIVSGVNAPIGTKWENRRIVQCWSTLSGDTDWKTYGGSYWESNQARNPR